MLEERDIQDRGTTQTALSHLPVDAATRDVSRVVTTTRKGEDKFQLVHYQDVEQILKTIKFLPDAMSRKKVAESSFRHFASIPNIFASKWAAESGTKLYSKEWMEYVSKQVETKFKGFKLRY